MTDRDALASTVKAELDSVEFHGGSVSHHTQDTQLGGCHALLTAAAGLAAAG